MSSSTGPVVLLLQDLYRQCLEVTQVALIALDLQERVTFVNRRACEILGFEESGILGRNWFADFVPGRHRTRTHELFEHLTDGQVERVEFFESPILTRSGAERVLSWRLAVLRDERGRLTGVACSGEDVMARRQLDIEGRNLVENLRSANELALELAAARPETDLYPIITQRLRVLTGAVAVSASEYDPDARDLRICHLALEGHLLDKVNQILGQSLTSLRMPVNPGQMQMMLNNIVGDAGDMTETTFGAVPKVAGRAIQGLLGIRSFTGIVFAYEQELLGTAVIAARSQQLPVSTDLLRNIAYVAAVALRRRRAEDARRRYADRLGLLREVDQAILAAQSPESIALAALNRTAQIADCERASVVVFDNERQTADILAAHYDGQTRLGVGARMPLSEFPIELLQNNEVRNISDTRTFAEPTPAIVQLRNEGIRSLINVPLLVGRRLIGSVNLASRRPGNFTPEILDIARQVAAELAIAIHQTQLQSELKRYADDLERHVRELESAVKELEAFSYSVSHDLRAPLRAIDGFSRVLLDEYSKQLPEPGQRYLVRVRENTKHMDRLIEDLLKFSRLSRQPIEKKRIDPLPLVRSVLEQLQDQRDGRNVEIVLGRLPACQVDGTLLQQVYFNLVANALKFTRKREHAVIEIGAFTTLPNGRTNQAWSPARPFPTGVQPPVYFVRDNGVGFDDREAEKAFTVFQRLHPGEEYEGTGVGLAIVHRIVHRFGGQIWVEAGIDRGATFYFTLQGLDSH